MNKILNIIGIIFLISITLFSFYRIVYQANPGLCNGCGRCYNICPNDAIYYDGEMGSARINQELCDGCGLCLEECGAFYVEDGRAVIIGTVINSETGFPMRDAVVQLDTISANCGLFGDYSFTVTAGIYNLTCSAEGYTDSIITYLEIFEFDVSEQNFALNPPTGSANNVVEKPRSTINASPNPFNPSTTISFELNSEFIENIAIGIYNLKGQKNKEFDIILSGVEGESNSIIWNGTDDNDQPVSSGIYLYKLKSDGKIKASNKMILLK